MHTTFRSTLQGDSPYFRGRLSPFNSKHGIVDPSHTFTNTPNHPSMKYIDFSRTDLKHGMDKTTTKIDHLKRETYDYSGNMIRRLHEDRDY